MQANLTRGKVVKTLVLYSLPIIATNILLSLFNMTDVAVIGRVSGGAAAAGVGVGGQYVYLISNIAVGLGVGVSIVTGNMIGKNDSDGASKVLGTTLIGFLIVSIVLGIGFYFLTPVVLSLMKAPGGVSGFAGIYVKISIVGLPFSFIYNALASFLRGTGDSKTPMFILLGAVLLNIGLDFLFVGLFDKGAGGAALATVIAELFAAATAVLYIVIKRKVFGIDRVGEIFSFDLKLFGKLMKMGVPVAILNSAATLSFMALTRIVNGVSGIDRISASGAHAMATRYNGLAVLPARGMASGIAAMTAQNAGAGKYGRIRETFKWGMIICVSFGVLTTVFTAALPYAIMFVMGGDDAINNIGAIYMRVMCPDYILVPLGVTAYGIVEGRGKTYVSMIINAAASLVIRIPAAYVLGIALNFGIVGIAAAIPIASLIQAAAIWIYILKKRKQLLPCEKSGIVAAEANR